MQDIPLFQQVQNVSQAELEAGHVKFCKVQELQLQPLQSITPAPPPPDVEASVSCFKGRSGRVKEIFSKSRPRATALISASCGMRTICWPGMFRDRPRRGKETKPTHLQPTSAAVSPRLFSAFRFAPGSGKCSKVHCAGVPQVLRSEQPARRPVRSEVRWKLRSTIRLVDVAKQFEKWS